MATALTLCDGPHSWSVLLSQPEQIHLLPIVSLTEFFSMRHQEPELQSVQFSLSVVSDSL